MKVAIIAGGSSGIGQASAEHFLRHDYRVLSLARRKHPNPHVESHLLNLIDLQATKLWLEQVPELLSGATRITLVLAASTQPLDTAIKPDFRGMQEVLTLNVQSPALLISDLLPLMKPGSSVIFVGSTLSEKGVPGCLSYVTAKHAMVGLMRATAQDLNGTGIHSVCICPGFTRTPMLQKNLDANPGFENAIKKMVHFKRLIEPHEIADIIYSSSTQPIFNGAVLHANLGQVEN